jgi:hypothetical protein
VLAVRGSVLAGIVDPEVPDFLYVGKGAATFTNDAGSTDMRPGHAIAVPSRTTAVMRLETMPPAIRPKSDFFNGIGQTQPIGLNTMKGRFWS